ncbi:acyl-CoA dehydrogenase family protein [Caenimonas sp. SL110]|uniref:acyl-CoA dehydrogenase family protein n=1 Tax=Caenimonas sp. SL110 TaxID=1450524 RepID=UPI000ACE87C8|nr:acyl-CoA dehydrogenase family protein [Caenimonas sp. SL110]
MRPHNDQQRMLADAARQFAQGHCESARLRACRGRTPDFDAGVWAEMAALGWLSVLVPEADGGLGSGLGEMGQLVYEWGAGGGAEPLVACGVLALTMLVDCDGPARAALLERTMQGSAMPALAWMEDGAKCVPQSGGWRVSGNARFVTPADASDFLVMFPRRNELPALHVRAGAAGITVQRELRADGTAACWLQFDGVDVTPDCLLASAATARLAAEKARDFALIMAAVSMAGTMRTINALTQEYLRTRVQFGKPIGSFQALQHKAVDMHIAEQMARDVAQHACTRVDAGCTPSERACAASRAKARAGDALDRIARMAVQLHGAIGFTDEYDLSLHLGRALTFSAWLGNADEHVSRYARHAAPFEAAQA